MTSSSIAFLSSNPRLIHQSHHSFIGSVSSIHSHVHLNHIKSTTRACLKNDPVQEDTSTPSVTKLPSEQDSPPKGLFSRLKLLLSKRKSLKANALRNYGVAALLSYGLFDALTYSISFLLSLRAYLAAGKVLTWSTLPQVLALMWGINNLSRPFRIAGALALAPVVDRRVVKPITKFFNSLRSDEQSNSNQ